MHDDPRLAVAELGDIVTVWAHPDDESFLAAGLLAMAAGSGARTACITATAGEAGGPADLQAELSWRRPEELQIALSVLGVEDHVLLGCPDGGCAAVDADEAAAVLATLIAARRPDTVVTFGADGLTGHPDHQAVSRWVDLAVARLGPGAPRVLHATEIADQVATLAGLPQADITGLTAVSLHDRADLALELRLPPEVVDLKVRALRAHRSQTAALESRLGPETLRAWVSIEPFVAARVPAEVGA